MSKWYFAKVGTFLILFVAVVMTAYYLRSEGFLGELRPVPKFEFLEMTQNLKWCPRGTKSIALEESAGTQQARFFTSPKVLRDLCLFRIETFDSKKGETKTFRTILRAQNLKNQTELLEVDLSGQLFKYRGMPFRSKELEGMLKTIPSTGS